MPCVITQNGQIWFHDGMTLQHSMRYEGFLDTKLCSDIFYSNSGNATSGKCTLSLGCPRAVQDGLET